MILCILRSISWSPPGSPQRWIGTVTQLVIGLALSLLGLLDIGRQTYNIFSTSGGLSGINAMFHLLGGKWPLAIVLGGYAIVYISEVLLSRYGGRRGGKIENIDCIEV